MIAVHCPMQQAQQARVLSSISGSWSCCTSVLPGCRVSNGQAPVMRAFLFLSPSIAVVFLPTVACPSAEPIECG